MIILYAALAADVALLLLTLFWLKKKPYKAEKEVLSSLGEAQVTVVLGVFSLLVSYFMIAAKLIDITATGTDVKTYLLIGVFSVACSLLGCYLLLYTYIKKYVLLRDAFVAVSVFGDVTEVKWREVKSASVPMLTKNVRLKTDKGRFTVHGGNTKQYKDFLKCLKDRLPDERETDAVRKLYNSMQ